MRGVVFALACVVAGHAGPAAAAAPVHAQTQQLVAPMRTPGERFGATIATDGDLGVIAAPGRTVAYNNAGVVHVLTRVGGVWTVGALIDEATSTTPGRVMGRSAAIQGGLLAVGAPGYNTDRGGAYVYLYDLVIGWQLQILLTNPVPVVGGRFGVAVGFGLGVGGEHVLVGETVETLPAVDAITGKVHVFDRSTGWMLAQTIVPQDLEAGDRFGLALAVDGDRAIIGAPGKEGGRGAAYVFERAAGVWMQTDKLVIAEDRVAGDYFGAAVAISGETVLVGARGRLGDQGAAYVFERDGAGWVQRQALVADVSLPMELFGADVALRGDRALVTGHGFELDPMVGPRGGGYLFARDDEGFRLLAALRAEDGVPGDYLGVGAALTDNEVFLGAPYDDAPGQPMPDLASAPGSAYLFGLTQALGEPCARDLDCADAARCCDHVCAAVVDCEPVTQTTGGVEGSSSSGEPPTTGDASTSSSSSSSTGSEPPPAAQFEPGDAGCACDAGDRGLVGRVPPMMVATILLIGLSTARRGRRSPAP